MGPVPRATCPPPPPMHPLHVATRAAGRAQTRRLQRAPPSCPTTARSPPRSPESTVNALFERSGSGNTASTTVPVGPPPVPPPGPIAQSVAIGFRSVYIAAALVALVWLTSNVRQIPSDSQAVVMRFGRIVRTQEAGLLIAWPRPIEHVELLPGPERQLSQDVPALPAPTDKAASLIGPGSEPGNSPGSDNFAPSSMTSAYMTGDSNAVLL